MSNLIMAKQNSRTITGDDKIFGISKLAKEMIAKEGKDKVVNATIGSLLDDKGDLVVFASIVNVLRNLSPVEFGDYAPIAGTADYLETVKTALFGKYIPEGYIEAVATPGGTGAIRNTIQNYSERGYEVLTSDLFWAPYRTICEELERSLVTYQLFTEDLKFNSEDFNLKINKILGKQDSLVILFNAPSHNPTGLTPSDEEWDKVIEVIKNSIKETGKKITLFVDAAYIDFSGDPDECRKFFLKFSNLPEDFLVISAFSMSKGYTLYGMRSGAMVCTTSKKEIADEFKMVNMFSNRGTWSNGTHPAMATLVNVFENKQLLVSVNAERKKYAKILTERGAAFTEAAKEVGLPMYPYSSGFFITVPCENQEEIGLRLQKDGVFVIPLNKGLRIAVSAISENSCRKLPAIISNAIKEING